MKNKLSVLFTGWHYDIISSSRVCREMGLRHCYDLCGRESRCKGFRSVWINSKGTLYKCKYLLSEPIDHHGRIVNYIR